MRRCAATIVVAAVACSASLGSPAVCLDENYVSGYHIPPEKEFRSAQAVAIATVVSAKEAPAPYSGLDEGTVYRVRIEETLRGKLYKSIDLFSQNNSGRFGMEIGHRYLLFVSNDRGILYIGSCGSSGKLPESAATLEAVRTMKAKEG